MTMYYICHCLDFGAFGWSVILESSMTDFQTSKFCGIGLGIWPLFGIKHMIFF